MLVRIVCLALVSSFLTHVQVGLPITEAAPTFARLGCSLCAIPRQAGPRTPAACPRTTASWHWAILAAPREANNKADGITGPLLAGASAALTHHDPRSCR